MDAKWISTIVAYSLLCMPIIYYLPCSKHIFWTGNIPVISVSYINQSYHAFHRVFFTRTLFSPRAAPSGTKLTKPYWFNYIPRYLFECTK